MVKVTLKRIFIPNTLAFELPAGNTKQAIINVISKCKEKHGDYVQVTIDTPKKPRTQGLNSQNSLWHSQCSQICEFTGESMETVKMYIKEQAVAMGYKTEYSSLLKKHIPVSSATVDTVMFGYLVEQAYILAGEFGIVLRELEK